MTGGQRDINCVRSPSWSRSQRAEAGICLENSATVQHVPLNVKVIANKRLLLQCQSLSMQQSRILSPTIIF